MLSSTDVKQLKFEKAVWGGYDMQSVDAAFTQLTDDYEKMEQQNIELRSKMKVLVDKIEEYRRVEDGIRQALTTAQNIAEETMEKANREAERILGEAKEEAEQITQKAEQKGSLILRQYEDSIVQQKTMLREAQHESAYFIEMMTRRFREESERIAGIPSRYGLKLEDDESDAAVEQDGSFSRTFSEPLISEEQINEEDLSQKDSSAE